MTANSPGIRRARIPAGATKPLDGMNASRKHRRWIKWTVSVSIHCSSAFTFLSYFVSLVNIDIRQLHTKMSLRDQTFWPQRHALFVKVTPNGIHEPNLNTFLERPTNFFNTLHLTFQTALHALQPSLDTLQLCDWHLQSIACSCHSWCKQGPVWPPPRKQINRSCFVTHEKLWPTWKLQVWKQLIGSLVGIATDDALPRTPKMLAVRSTTSWFNLRTWTIKNS